MAPPHDRPVPGRVAMLSVHTSPLAQPGTGDAGGLNTYVRGLASALARRGVPVDLLTRATAPDQPPVVRLEDGVRVLHVDAGPRRDLAKEDLPPLVETFTDAVLGAGTSRDSPPYDVVHAHYWLSGLVGARLARAWRVPLLHSMHTMARVKDLHRGPGQAAEPAERVRGEEAVVAAADGLVASTLEEARELVELYDAPPGRVDVVPPGVDLADFGPVPRSGTAEEERVALGLAPRDRVLLFAGRLQPLKGPDVLLRAAAQLLDGRPPAPGEARLVVVVVGGPSGSGEGRRAQDELRDLARSLHLLDDPRRGDVVRFVAPQPPRELARWYRAADVVAVPSRTESFGLVALEAQACGTPVVATATGGLRTAVDDGRTGVLVPDADPAAWAAALDGLLADDARRAAAGAAAAVHAAAFSWDATAARTLGAYARAGEARHRGPGVTGGTTGDTTGDATRGTAEHARC